MAGLQRVEEVTGLGHAVRLRESLAELGEDPLALDEGLEVHARDPDHGGAAVLELLANGEADVLRGAVGGNGNRGSSVFGVRGWRGRGGGRGGFYLYTHG